MWSAVRRMLKECPVLFSFGLGTPQYRPVLVGHHPRCRLTRTGRSERFRRASVANENKGSDRLVLGIESSCDDTGVAIVSSSGQILAESLVTQIDLHAPWGGVVPDLARQGHEDAIDGAVQKVINECGVDPRDLDAVAVTIGPGLSLCLKVGVLKAHRFAFEHALPIVPIHHMEAHALVARMGHQNDVTFPFLCVLASGGHNLILVVHGVGQYTQIGTTLDDSLGEAYDKVARLLGLELNPSGGAALEKFALDGDPAKFNFKVPMKHRKNCDFSYSGLKTSIRMAIDDVVGEEKSDANRQIRADIAAGFQRVAVQHLEDRCDRACDWALQKYPEISHLIAAGGVAANKYVRERLEALASKFGMELVCPPPRLCTDNGVMVAWAGIERYDQGFSMPVRTHPLSEDEWVDVRPRWPLTNSRAFQEEKVNRATKRKRLYTSLNTLTERLLSGESSMQDFSNEMATF